MADFPGPVWWVDAAGCAVDVIGRGEGAGHGTVNSELALVLSGDSSFAIEGSQDDVLRLLLRAHAKVKEGVTERRPVTYWLTVAIPEQELADALGCDVDAIEAQDYIGAIREHAEIVRLEEMED